MKQPRLDDFDPHAKVHQLKSSMDNMPTIEKPSAAAPPPLPQVTPVQHVQTPRAQPARRVTPKASKRKSASTENNTRKIKTRQSYDIYEDQILSLNKLSYKEKMQGGTGSMSAMVRDALDDYLAKQGIKVPPTQQKEQ